jgi:hypothetical protein
LREEEFFSVVEIGDFLPSEKYSTAPLGPTSSLAHFRLATEIRVGQLMLAENNIPNEGCIMQHWKFGPLMLQMGQ